MVMKKDWKTVEMPAKREHFVLEEELTAQDIQKIKEGHEPQEMEDKWFMYYEDGKLFIHRSWTGYCIYIVEISDKGTMNVVVNRDSSQYKETCTWRDHLQLKILFNDLTGKQEENADLMKQYLASLK